MRELTRLLRPHAAARAETVARPRRRAAELKRAREMWEAGERSKRDVWVAEKTRELKELTIRGLEPQVQHLVAAHREEARALERSRAPPPSERRSPAPTGGRSGRGGSDDLPSAAAPPPLAAARPPARGGSAALSTTSVPQPRRCR